MKRNLFRPIFVPGGFCALFLLATGCGGGRYYDAVSYEPAGGWSDVNNAQMVRAQATSQQQSLAQLTEQRARYQARVDQLATELSFAGRRRAAEIMQELERLSTEIDGLDAQLGALTTTPTTYAAAGQGQNAITVEVLPTTMEQEQESVVAVPASADRNREVVRADTQVRYCVQIGLLNHASMESYADLQGVTQVKRPDGYAYYYGSYATKAQADAAARQLRGRAKYRDAFTVALRGTQRIALP